MSKFNSALSDFVGERCIQAPFGFIVASYPERSMVGGVILAPMTESKTWERWKGTAILIPSSIELAVKKEMRYARIDQMMTRYLGVDNDDDRTYWKETWHA